jgi:RNA polymerase sigma-70 factor (ECF subfamily)
MTPPGANPGSQSSTSTSRSLLERVRADETGAWDRLVQLYAPLVLSWCRRCGLQDPDAADVFQDVFLAVATHIGTFRKERARDTFRGWLRVITQRKVLDLLRRQGREPGGTGGTDAWLRLSAVPAPELASDADHVAERALILRGLETIREEFEPRTWQAFWRTTIDGRAPKDVADELSMSAGAVRVAKSRVLQRLREELGDLME